MAVQPRTRLISNVANKGFEQITVFVHGAINVPNIDDRLPNAYVTSQSKYTLATQEIGDKPNATNIVEGNNPVWNDIIFVETIEENVDSEELVILLIDEPRYKNIGEYRIPWKWLQPFYQYHLELVMAARNEFNEMKLYVSITRKQNLLSKQDFKYYGIEVYINRFEIPMIEKQSIYAVGRVVPDYFNYKQNVLKQSTAVVETTTVSFPSPTYHSFIPKQYNIDGYPQITLATKDSINALWKHNFLFSLQEEKDAMFVDDSYLIIEFYPYRRLTQKSWHLKDLLGWIAIKLDQRTYEALDNSAAKYGVKTEDLIVESDGGLIGENNKILTAQILLRLVRDKHPKSMLSDVNIESAPTLNSYYSEENLQNGIIPVYLQSRFTKGDAKYQILRSNSRSFNNQYITDKRFHDSSIEIKHVSDPQPINRNIKKKIIELEDNYFDLPSEYRLGISNIRHPKSDDLEEWVFYYNRLSNNLYSVIKRLNEEVVVLKSHINNIESSNVQLRSKLGNFEEKKYNLLKLAHLNEKDKSKINELFLELRTKLIMKSNENSELRAKLSILQKEIEKKNMAENEYQKLINAHKLLSQEMQLLQIRLNKANNLEETCRKQELVIERLERLIHSIMEGKQKGYKTAPLDDFKKDKTSIFKDGIDI